MKKTNANSKRSFGSRLKHFFKHYFFLLVLACVCAVLLTVLITYAL